MGHISSIIRKYDKKRGIKAIAPRSSFRQYFKRNYDMYLLLVPGFVYILIFHYLPLYGITLAFKDFNIFAGKNPLMSIINSPWVGIRHFEDIFGRAEFQHVFINTLIISFLKLAFLFPLPVILAILLNEIRINAYKKSLQTILYLPHFISWTVVCGIFISILGASGIVNTVLQTVAGEKVMFLMDKSLFRGVLVFTDGWKEMGWGTIIYLAAIAGIEQEIYEAATVDGADKFQKIINITIPGLMPTIIMLLILRVGKILDAGFEQILVMYNPTVYEVADIIGTYVYRIGLGQMNFSLGTAVGLFNSVIGFVLVMVSNRLSRVFTGKSIW